MLLSGGACLLSMILAGPVALSSCSVDGNQAAAASGCVGAISPGVPATFLANYRAAMSFLEGLERYCSVRGMLAAFRSSKAYGSFTRRWKLSIYFSTRFQVRQSAGRD